MICLNGRSFNSDVAGEAMVMILPSGNCVKRMWPSSDEFPSVHGHFEACRPKGISNQSYFHS